MKVHFAPIHGMTLAHYRDLHARIYGGIHTYYAPFIVTTDERQCGDILFEDVLPQNNMETTRIIPQLLSNNGDEFTYYMSRLHSMGYREINLNIGCPFPTVTRKLRGSGLLQYPEKINRLLEKAFENAPCPISVKMRLGFEDLDEGFETMKVLNKYPLKNVIIHGRTGLQKYEGVVDLQAFKALAQACDHEVIYNGDIYTVEDFKRISSAFPEISQFMIGRGILRNPFLAAMIQGQIPDQEEAVKKLRAFHDGRFDYYKNRIEDEQSLIGKMKDHWTYSHQLFESPSDRLKAIRSSQDRDAYMEAVEQLFDSSRILL